MIMVGRKKSLGTGGRPNKPRLLVPDEEWLAFSKAIPKKTIPRVAEEDPQEEGQSTKKKRKRSKKTNQGKAKKYKFHVDDYTKVMDHIANDIMGKPPEEWTTDNRLKSIENYQIRGSATTTSGLNVYTNIDEV